MSNVFIIDSTDGTLSLVMPPGELNGPGSTSRDTDLRIYGMGTLLWGEGVNENILRSSENFAVAEKAASPGTPQDETDLGPGRGITRPLEGQSWYNKTDKQLYICINHGGLGGSFNSANIEWAKSTTVIQAATNPLDPIGGDLWLDTATSIGPDNQLMVHNGTAWVSVAANYLPLAGGIMTGGIDMSSNTIINLPTPTLTHEAANVGYVQTREAVVQGNLNTHASDLTLHLTANQNTILDTLEANLIVTSLAMGVDLAKMGGFNVAYPSTSVVNEIHNRIQKDETDTMAAGQTIVLGRDPNTGTQEAATASWVETAIAATGTGGGDRIVKYWNTLSASALDGDIHVDGTGKIWIKAGGVWQQVYPAQYS